MGSKFEKLAASATEFGLKKCGAEPPGDACEWLGQHPDEVIRYLFEHENQRISQRTKIIAYCVAAKRKVRDTNSLLRKYHREELYVRNAGDIAIMRTLELGHSAEYLCDLSARITSVLENKAEDGFFTKADRKGKQRFVCSIETMEQYLDHSRIGVPVWQIDPDDENLSQLERDKVQSAKGDRLSAYEKKVTREMTDELKAEFDLAIAKSDDYFLRIVEGKRDMFSVVRDRTRREFVRSLYDYAKTISERGNMDEIYALYMNVDTESDPRARPINFKNLSFDVNEFYQGHLFGVEERDYSTKSNPDEYLPESKEERIAWLEENTEKEDVEQEAAQKKCAKLLQGLLQGKNDISRTLFLAVILYFISRMNEQVSIQKINATLSKCGWRQIDVRGEDAFDLMVVDIMDYYNTKDISYSDYLDIMLQDLEEPVFDKYEGDDFNMTMNEAITKTLR